MMGTQLYLLPTDGETKGSDGAGEIVAHSPNAPCRLLAG
jgi:hypothetical protein